MARFVELERERHREDGADGLPGHHLAGHEGPAVAGAVDLVADRLVLVASADEVRVQRVHAEALVDRVRPRPQGLGDDLAAVETAPRVARADADVHIGAVGLELHHGGEVHA